MMPLANYQSLERLGGPVKRPMVTTHSATHSDNVSERRRVDGREEARTL